MLLTVPARFDRPKRGPVRGVRHEGVDERLGLRRLRTLVRSMGRGASQESQLRDSAKYVVDGLLFGTGDAALTVRSGSVRTSQGGDPLSALPAVCSLVS